MSLPLTRRSFLAGSAAMAVGSGCLPGIDAGWPDSSDTECSAPSPRVTPGDATQAGRVVEVFDAALTSGPRVSTAAATAGLRKLLLALTGTGDLQAAWARLLPGLQAGQVVGIKVNVLNPKVPTHPEVVKALVDLLLAGAGLAAGQIVVWDRRLDELTKAGFTPASMSGAAVEGTWEDAENKGNGRGYEYGATCLGGRTTHLSNVLTRRIDHLINVAVMKRHTLSGVTGVLKNHYGSIDNPGDFHDKSQGNTVVEKWLDRAIPAVNALSEVQRKTRLLLLDATIGVSKGGTDSPADCAPNRLALGLDPVALDLRAREIRDLERGAAGKDTETTSDGWLAASAAAGLGKQAVTLQAVK